MLQLSSASNYEDAHKHTMGRCTYLALLHGEVYLLFDHKDSFIAVQFKKPVFPWAIAKYCVQM